MTVQSWKHIIHKRKASSMAIIPFWLPVFASLFIATWWMKHYQKRISISTVKLILQKFMEKGNSNQNNYVWTVMKVLLSDHWDILHSFNTSIIEIIETNCFSFILKILFSFRLLYPFTCPHNGQRNDTCMCTDDGSANAGFSSFSKVRVDLHNMKINSELFFLDLICDNLWFFYWL